MTNPDDKRAQRCGPDTHADCFDVRTGLDGIDAVATDPPRVQRRHFIGQSRRPSPMLVELTARSTIQPPDFRSVTWGPSSVFGTPPSSPPTVSLS